MPEEGVADLVPYKPFPKQQIAAAAATAADAQAAVPHEVRDSSTSCALQMGFLLWRTVATASRF